MRSIYIIFFAGILLITGCHKKNKHPEDENSDTPAVITGESELKCQDLPPPPENFEWHDSLPDGNKSINAFLFDPVNPDKIIYVANGDAFGFNKLYFYDVPSKQAKYICSIGSYLPQVNRKGWITFSDAENNVYFIKNNSEALIPLSTDKRSHDPKWDYTGNYIYYYTESYFNVKSQLIKIDTAGSIKEAFEIELPHTATFKKSNKLIILETKNTLCTLIVKDLTPPTSERILFTGPKESKPGRINFGNLTLDNNDENFYWSNSNGIFKCNLTTLKIDTVYKNCQNFIFNNPIISFKDNELTYSHEVIKPISSVVLYHQFRAMELNLITKQAAEIKIFP